MKAIRIHEFGGPDVLRTDNIAVPAPADDEVLVKVYATSINPIDWKIRKGASQAKFPVTLPFTLGWDVSGVVEQKGDNVTGFEVGTEVYSRPSPARNGAYAEYIVIKASEVARKPNTIDHVHAAAVPLAGLTAWQGLFEHGKLQKGERVLIHAASGGVGTFAVQLAKWKGAYVIGTTSEKNIDLVKQLGADEVIDYNNEQFDEKLKDIDLVFDMVGGDTQTRSIKVLKDGGRLVTTVKPEDSQEAKDKNIQIQGYMALSKPADLDQIADLIDNGKIKPVIAKILTLDDAKEAQELSEKGHVAGKIVLKVV
jgi:NADPH:quinone reductase-like Zn-dependent oxidoreductase